MEHSYDFVRQGKTLIMIPDTLISNKILSHCLGQRQNKRTTTAAATITKNLEKRKKLYHPCYQRLILEKVRKHRPGGSWDQGRQ